MLQSEMWRNGAFPPTRDGCVYSLSMGKGVKRGLKTAQGGGKACPPRPSPARRSRRPPSNKILVYEDFCQIFYHISLPLKQSPAAKVSIFVVYRLNRTSY